MNMTRIFVVFIDEEAVETIVDFGEGLGLIGRRLAVNT